MIKNHEDAEELVMNTLLKVWQHKQRLAEVRKFDDYLFGILRQEIAGRARKKVHHAISFEDIKTRDLDAIATEEFDLNYQELQTRYLAAVEKLTPKQREVFLYSREQDLSQQEIAEKTGLSANTVNNHITTALKVLRNEIKEYPLTLLPILYYLSSIPY